MKDARSKADVLMELLIAQKEIARLKAILEPTRPRGCKHHETGVEPCPFCDARLWPTRDLRAAADFAGNPVNRPDGVVPEVKYMTLCEAIRDMGRRWSEVERFKHQVLRTLYTTKNRMVREAHFAKGAVDIGRLERACIEIGKGSSTHPDPLVAWYMRTILEDDFTW